MLRLNDNGTIPPDNPFVGEAGTRPEIYSLGHRDHLGLFLHPSGLLFQAEHGPNGGDESEHHQGGAQLRLAGLEFRSAVSGAACL